MKSENLSNDELTTSDSIDSDRTSTEAEITDVDTRVSSQDTIKVICRFRPEKKSKAQTHGTPHGTPHSSGKNSKDKHNEPPALTAADVFNIYGDAKIVEVTSDRKTVNDNIEKKKYCFDKIFGPDTAQEDIFGEVEGVIDSVMAGFNGAIMAYGQTAAGKSYTMEGPSLFDKNSQGIISRSIEKLFHMISQADETIQFQIIASYIEVYCEKIRDLLNPVQDNMKIRESKTEGFLVHDITEAVCKDHDSVIRLIEEGKANRASAPTLMNAESSRSHSIFSISVVQKNLDTGRKKKARLFLVDLAGSEKVGKSGAVGTRLEEAKNINMSLTTLGMVINALCEGLSHVPYRDSKLTKVLMETLGGNSKTVLIICCAPEPQHLPETISSLRFGERAKKVRNQAIMNEEISVEELKLLLAAAKREILMLRAQLAALPSNNTSSSSSSSDDHKDDVKLKVDDIPVEEEKNILPKRTIVGTRRLSERSLAISKDVEDLLNQTDDEWKDDLYEPYMMAKEQITRLESQSSLLRDDLEEERARYDHERDQRLHLESEVSALKGIIHDLEGRLLKQSLESSSSSSSKKNNVISSPSYNSDFHDIDEDHDHNDDNEPKIFKVTRKKAASVSSSSGNTMLRQHRDDESSVNISKLYDLLEGVLSSLNTTNNNINNKKKPHIPSYDDIDDDIILSASSSSSSSSLADKYDAMKYEFESHLEKLRARLSDEHEMRMNAEMEMEAALIKLDQYHKHPPPSSSSSSSSSSSVSNDFFSFVSSSFGLSSSIPIPSSASSASSSSFNHHQVTLALEESQARVAELVTELEAVKEAHAIATETKESALRQLLRQNTNLANDNHDLTSEVDRLMLKNEQMSKLLQSMQRRGSIRNLASELMINGGTKQPPSLMIDDDHDHDDM